MAFYDHQSRRHEDNQLLRDFTRQVNSEYINEQQLGLIEDQIIDAAKNKYGGRRYSAHASVDERTRRDKHERQWIGKSAF